MVKRLHKLFDVADDHFEVLFLTYSWFAASLLAAFVGRPHLGIIGLVTVLPFLLAYVWRVARQGGSDNRLGGSHNRSG
jgi:hypothetical protein